MNIIEKMTEMSDETYQKFHSKLIPDCTKKVLGVRIPDLRKLAKQLADSDWQAHIAAIGCDTYEEITLKGFIIGYAKAPVEEIIEELRSYMPLIDNWATCDTVCSNLKITKKYNTQMHDFIKECLKSDETYTQRFACVMLLDFYITEEDVDSTIALLDAVSSDQYYVQMAVAWALSICMIKFPDKTLAYMESNNHLDIFTFNKTLQKACESYRISPQMKEKLRKMKKR